jgi:hypothetical protein
MIPSMIPMMGITTVRGAPIPQVNSVITQLPSVQQSMMVPAALRPRMYLCTPNPPRSSPQTPAATFLLSVAGYCGA